MNSNLMLNAIRSLVATTAFLVFQSASFAEPHGIHFTGFPPPALTPLLTSALERSCMSVTLQGKHTPNVQRPVCIPPEYIIAPPPTPVQPDMAVSAIWPTMKGSRSVTGKELAIRQEAVRSSLGILFGPVENHPDIRARFEAMRRYRDMRKPAAPAFGFEHLESAPKETATQSDQSWDVFYSGEGNDFTYIFCPEEGSRPITRCEAEFISDGMLVRVSFARAFMPQWPELREKTKELIGSFTPLQPSS